MNVLKGKVALVTGASRGIGRSIAKRFGAEGALVAVHYGRSDAEARSAVEEIEAAGGRAFALQADMASVPSINSLFERLDRELLDRTGSSRFDILVNNAAIATFANIEETTEQTFDDLFNVNVKGLFFTTQKALPRLNDNGRIINVTSAVTRIAFPGSIAYAATKGAVDVLTRNLAAFAGPRGITVNGLAPGAIHTDMGAPMFSTEEGVQTVLDMQTLKRLGSPEDIAGAALLIASDDARWMTANYVDASGGSKL